MKIILYNNIILLYDNIMDKFICKRCNYLLNISKITNYKKIDNINDFMYEYNNLEQDFIINFDKKQLENHINKKNINDTEKTKILSFYDSIINKNLFNKYILNCPTCGTEYKLEPETVIYNLNLKKQDLIFDDDDLDYIFNDNTLPRTKDYICKNSNCSTNIDGFDLKLKEAVFYRAKNSYITKYACTNCKTSWII